MPVLLDEFRQLGSRRRVDAAQLMQRARCIRHDERARHLVGFIQLICDLRHLRHVDPLEDRHRSIALAADGRLERLPGQVARSLDRLLVSRLPAFELGLARDAELDDPVAHARHAVVLALEPKPFLRLVPLVAAAGRVALRLRHLGDMDQRWLVLPAHLLDRA